MKNKVYLLILLLAIIMIGNSFYSAQIKLDKSIHDRAKQIYQIRVKEYNVIYEDKKHFLDSFAKFLSSSKPIIEGYLENNRTKIIDFVMPLYKSLYPKQLEEIHFFKRPAISFVNFANLKVYNQNVSKARADILWVNTSFSPSTHFYVCRLYPGLRATYPIVYNDRLLGSISFGLSIKEFKELFEKLNTKVSIYLNDNNLKTFLLPKKYEQFKKLPLIDGYRVIGNEMNISLKEGYELRDNKLYTKIKTNDFFNKTFAYIVIQDDMSDYVNMIKSHIKNDIISDVVYIIFIFIVFIAIFKWIFIKLNVIDKILNNIKLRRFDKIPKKVEIKDEFDEYKNKLIDVAQHLRVYMELLSKKAEEYEIKAYKDGLTGALNRTFLEEKSDDLLFRFQTLNIPVGIIMIDIDDFKKINDTYGHDVGDLVLVHLSKAIRSIIRKDDFFIRYGGEEFLIILPESNIEETKKIAEKIRQKVESLVIEINSAKKVKFTISLGVTELHQTDTKLSESIKRADINLYKAKKAGKNRVEI